MKVSYRSLKRRMRELTAIYSNTEEKWSPGTEECSYIKISSSGLSSSFPSCLSWPLSKSLNTSFALVLKIRPVFLTLVLWYSETPLPPKSNKNSSRGSESIDAFWYLLCTSRICSGGTWCACDTGGGAGMELDSGIQEVVQNRFRAGSGEVLRGTFFAKTLTGRG